VTVAEAPTIPIPVVESEPAPAPAAAPSVALGIAEAADKTGVSAHTLRYYERIGLLSVPRDAAGRRIYGETELGRVLFITRLRLTAMPIRQIQAYFDLVEQGPSTEPERLALLERHRDEVLARMQDLQSALEAIEYKITIYGGTCSP
jgi:DNA-binding transcriptional MerR regulator